MDIDFGVLQGPTIGMVMREALRRAAHAIRGRQFIFEAQEKGRRADGGTDWVTDADRAAQEAIVKVLRKNFPHYGIIAEEEDLRVPCAHPAHDLRFTVDPLDGTAAFVRKQSHGIGSMIALLCDGEAIAAYVRDVNTDECYGFRPGSAHVHRITAAGTAVRLEIDPGRPLHEQYALLRDPMDAHGSSVQAFFRRHQRLFKSYEITGGSIGISVARLWKGEVGACIFPPHRQTPWDLSPYWGISRKMGFRRFALDDRANAVTDSTPLRLDEPYIERDATMLLHGSRAAEFAEFCRIAGIHADFRVG